MKRYSPYDIKTWAVEDNPSEKIHLVDKKALSNSELLSIALSINSNYPGQERARKILASANNNLDTLAKMSMHDLMMIPEVGKKRAAVIQAIFELGKRRNSTHIADKIQIKSSETIFNIFSPILSDLKHEEFWLLVLNRGNRATERYKISQGGLSETVIDTRIIMKKALDKLACAIIVCHNHPSGNKEPSEADINITRKLKKAAETLEIKLLDHVIIADKAYFSFADQGII